MASLGALILVIAWTVSFFFATIFECGRDMSLLWQSLKTFKENCGIYKYVQLGHAGSDVITDILVLSIPVPIIMKLHMDPGRKISLVFIFLLGAM